MGKLMKSKLNHDDQMYAAESDLEYEYPRKSQEDLSEMVDEISDLRYNQFGILDQKRLTELHKQRLREMQ